MLYILSHSHAEPIVDLYCTYLTLYSTVQRLYTGNLLLSINRKQSSSYPIYSSLHNLQLTIHPFNALYRVYLRISISYRQRRAVLHTWRTTTTTPFPTDHHQHTDRATYAPPPPSLSPSLLSPPPSRTRRLPRAGVGLLPPSRATATCCSRLSGLLLAGLPPPVGDLLVQSLPVLRGGELDVVVDRQSSWLW